MEPRLQQVLEGQEENYILPFYWQHGETAEELRKGMRVIRDSGIRAVCVESRPHPDFLGPKWWEDLEVILEEARSLGMKVWVLDDAHFPTGYCGGRVEERGAAAKRYLDHYTIDALGPAPEASFLIRLEEGEELIGVTAARRCGGQGEALEELADLTAQVKDGLLYWGVPEGYYRITVIKSVWKGTGRPGYVNLIDRRAVKFFLDTVYEPHWEHFREEFGKTFAGFFSDEPELGNCIGEYGFHSLIGQPTMLLPWCRELEELTAEVWGGERASRLTLLWSPAEGREAGARYEFMNMVTDLYGKNFCGQAADWCEAHGVEYIGHVIEDNGTHSHLGLGAGHYFKALWGQHMAGIDVVLQQIRPGYDGKDFYHTGGKGTYDGVFFHYGLAKLGSSLAHLDPRKRGRCMCEIFGAYGWTEGLKLMKWLADHMLVRGVNWFVPHAFTGRPFPDPDCPPHFYAQGRNPQYLYFRELMQYMNRVSHLISGGVHVAGTAVLYTAESEWLGEFRPFEETGRILAQAQLDYEVIPAGILENCRVEDGVLRAGRETYRALVVPPCGKIPEELAEWLTDAAERGLPVLFAGDMPRVTASGWRQREFFRRAEQPAGAERSGGRQAEMERPDSGPAGAKCSGGRQAEMERPDSGTAGAKRSGGRQADAERPDSGTRRYRFGSAAGSSAKLLDMLEALGVREVSSGTEAPYLRYYHCRQERGEFYLFFNEAPGEPLKTCLEIPDLERAELTAWYDAFDNKLYPADTEDGGRLSLFLEPGQAVILYAGESVEPASMPDGKIFRKAPFLLLPDDCWRVSLKAFDSAAFSEEEAFPALCNLTGPERDPGFSGTARYTTEFEWDREETEAFADFGQVFETMEVWLNGERQALRLAPPYRSALRGLRRKKNRLELLVINTLVHSQRDALSAAMPVEPSGLLGPVRLWAVAEVEKQI